VAVPVVLAGLVGRLQGGLRRRPWQRAWQLWRACHPEPTVAVTAMTTAFAVSAGRGVTGTLWVATAVLAGQLSVGWHNDYVDRDRDAAARRRDKPLAAGTVEPRMVGVAAVVALLVAAALSFGSGWRAASVHLVGLAAAWGYNAGVKGTAGSVLPYVVAFGAAPAFVVLGLPGHPLPPAWLVTATALLGAGAHFANVLPDIDDDLRMGVRGLPHRLGRRWSTAAAALLLGAASVLLAVAPTGGVDAIGAAALVTVAGLLGVALVVARQATRRRSGGESSGRSLGGSSAPSSGGSRWGFRLVLLVAVVDVALLIARGGVVAG
jgi:4-hydroxybenzoate polyprenyltransferase